jgi:hypothetical protein
MPSSGHIATPTVKVSARGATRLKSGHVWVYRSDIVSAGGVLPGCLVTVTDLLQFFANRDSDDLQ